jgi:hypothetical protein
MNPRTESFLLKHTEIDPSVRRPSSSRGNAAHIPRTAVRFPRLEIPLDAFSRHRIPMGWQQSYGKHEDVSLTTSIPISMLGFSVNHGSEYRRDIYGQRGRSFK